MGPITHSENVFQLTPSAIVADLKPYTTDRIIFPELRKRPETVVTRVDFQQLLQLVQIKFHDTFAGSGIEKSLNEIELTCYDDGLEALEGVIAYSTSSLPFPAKCLVLNLNDLDLSQDDSVNKFADTLNKMLCQLPQSQLAALRFIDDNKKLTEDMISNLIKLIEKNQIAIELTLPDKLKRGPMQREIDALVSDNIRTQRIKSWGKEPIAAAPQQAQAIAAPIRTRHIARKETLAMDMELQQEQQVSIQPSTEKEFQKAVDSDDQEIYTMEEFIPLASTEKSFAAIPTRLPDNVMNLWKNWVGALSDVEACRSVNLRISKPACEEIVRHLDRFEFGLDLNNLPSGFTLEKQGEVSYIHFSENIRIFSARNPLQVQLTELPGETPLANKQFKVWIEHTKSISNPTIELIHQIYGQLTTNKPYDKKAEQVFKQFLPQMLLLAHDQLNQLFKITMSEQGLDTEKFQFLLEQAKVYANNLKKVSKVDNDMSAVMEWDINTTLQKRLRHLFPDVDDESVDVANVTAEINSSINSSMEFIKQYELSKPLFNRSFSDCLLGQLVQGEDGLVDKIETLIKQVPNLNLNALLQVYIELGELGIDRFMALVNSDNTPNKSLFNGLYDQVFADNKSHIHLLDDAYITAMQTIQVFNPEERVWWDVLLSQHCAAQRDVNLLDLVEAFKTFRDELVKVQTHDGSTLKFPAVCKLQGVKSLPTALSRILSILQHAKKQDRVRQWQVVDQLDLSSNGSIKAVSTKGVEQWAFIVTEMDINAQVENELAKERKLSSVAYVAPSLPKYDPNDKDVLAKFVRFFFRHAAFQEENGQLPLEFYQYVHEKLTNPPPFPEKYPLSDKEKVYLYVLMVLSTTTAEYVSTMPTLHDAKAKFDQLLEAIQLKDPAIGLLMAIRNTTPRIFLLTSINKLTICPPLPVFLQIASMLSTAMQGNTLSLTHNKNKLEKSNKALNEYLTSYGTAVYDGMKWYTGDDYKKESLYFDYLDCVGEIDKLFPKNSEEKKEAARSLIQIISLFHLTINDIKQLYTDFFKDTPVNDHGFDIRSLEALNILRKMMLTDTRFEFADLKDILQAVKSSPFEVPIEVIKLVISSKKQKVIPYFPPDYLENYGRKEISQEVNEKIKKLTSDEQQQKQIKTILAHFSKADDHFHYDTIVDELITICQRLSATEKNKFINELAGSVELYTKPQGLDDPSNHFLKLLKAIHALGSPNEFINFIDCERDLLSRRSEEQKQRPGLIVDDLAQKADLYLRTDWSQIQSIPKFTISTFELAPRVIELILKTPMSALENDAYQKLLFNLCEKLNEVVADNPNSKAQFFELLDQHLHHFSPAAEGAITTSAFDYLLKCVDCLKDHFEKIEDKNVVLSLCLQFNGKTNSQLKPADLIELLNFIDTLDEDNRPIILKIAVDLINNHKGYTFDKLKDLCELFNDQDVGTQFAIELKDIYKTAPIPTIEQVMQWHEDAEDAQWHEARNDSSPTESETVETASYQSMMRASYTSFSLNPCLRDEVNFFNIDKANSQLNEFKGLSSDNRIETDSMNQAIQEVRKMTPAELLAILHSFKNEEKFIKDEDYYLLVAVAAELMYRSKGKDVRNEDGSVVSGSSMELNTTQYLAILSLLKTPGHVTSQIGTGEGKSRIMMILLACQFALGYTVDFVTADLQLATRDFVEFKSYFDMIGAIISLIFASSHEREYQLNGINFSDASNLSLFRNKARSLGQEDQVINADPKRRALALDEADKAFFDMVDTRFNYSKEGDKSILGMQWVYPMLMAYYAQKTVNISELDGKFTISPLELHNKNVDLSRENFKAFAFSHCTPIQQQRLKALSDNQIERWQESAVTASGLQFQRDFVIGREERVSTAAGTKFSSEAQIISQNRVLKGAKYSFGVHQCLQARLEFSRQHLDKEQNKQLRDELSQCEHEFDIPDEKQIIYSSTSKHLLDDYREGLLQAVTGTAGTDREKEEAAVFYGFQFGEDVKTMTFIEVPRDKGLKRVDKPIRLVKHTAEEVQNLSALNQQLENDKKAGKQETVIELTSKIQELEMSKQLQVLKQSIEDARTKNQAILVIAENDQESEYLFKKLHEVFHNDIQRVHSQLPKAEEDYLVGVAGEPGKITVSTGMIGRGTDISLKGDAKTYGLNVVVTYLPNTRDLEQIIGRSGRFGAAGETQLIIDTVRTQKALGQKLSPENWVSFEAGFDRVIENEQAIRERKKQDERLIKQTKEGFSGQLAKSFDRMRTKIEPDNLSQITPLWSAFLDETNKEWNVLWPQMQEAILQDQVNIPGIDELLASYKNKVQQSWDALYRDVFNLSLVSIGEKTNPVKLLPKVVPDFVLDEKTKNLFRNEVAVPVVAAVVEPDIMANENEIPPEIIHNAPHRVPDAPVWWRQPFASFRASSNKGKIVGAIGAGLAGAGIGAALIATGVLAPLGVALFGFSAIVTSIAIFAAIGLAVGGLLGFGGGALVDAKAKHLQRNEEESDDSSSSRPLARLHQVSEPKHKVDKNDVSTTVHTKFSSRSSSTSSYKSSRSGSPAFFTDKQSKRKDEHPVASHDDDKKKPDNQDNHNGPR